jgi:hypothetical protein
LFSRCDVILFPLQDGSRRGDTCPGDRVSRPPEYVPQKFFFVLYPITYKIVQVIATKAVI